MGDNFRRRGAGVAGVLLAALLSACETAGSDSSVAKSGATPQSESIDGTQASPEVAALPPEPEIDDDPERLLGLGPNALSDLLGRPELIRRESPAQVWQYRATDCVFDVVLYREVGSESVTSACTSCCAPAWTPTRAERPASLGLHLPALVAPALPGLRPAPASSVVFAL
jgi:hypothetical protein